MSKTGLEMTQKLNERNRNGYPNQLTLGYMDAINDLEKILHWQPTKLDDNQQAILEWLKDAREDSKNVIETISGFYAEIAPSNFETCLMATCEKLDKRQMAEVVQAFCEWELERSE